MVAVNSNRRPIVKLKPMVAKPAAGKTSAAQPLKAPRRTSRRNVNSLAMQPSTATSGKGASDKAGVNSSNKSIAFKATNRMPIKRKPEDYFTAGDESSEDEESEIESSENEYVYCRKKKKVKREHVDLATDYLTVFFLFALISLT
jgi:hypothetical protein